MMHTLPMIRAAYCFCKQSRHIEHFELSEALFLRLGDGRRVGDDDLVDAFAGFEFFEAVVAEETWSGNGVLVGEVAGVYGNGLRSKWMRGWDDGLEGGPWMLTRAVLDALKGSSEYVGLQEHTMRSDTDNMRRATPLHNRFRSRDPRRGLIHHVIEDEHRPIPHVADKGDHGVHFRIDKMFLFVVTGTCVGRATETFFR